MGMILIASVLFRVEESLPPWSSEGEEHMKTGPPPLAHTPIPSGSGSITSCYLCQQLSMVCREGGDSC